MEQELSVQGSKVYLGSIVSVRWMGVWYDGTVVQIGPHSNLFKVQDSKSGQEILIESKQLKQLDSKFTQSQEKHFAFNDGDRWLEVKVTDSNATGIAKVSWRKNVHSLETETWFAEENMAPVIQNILRKESLQASKSGLFPVKAIEEHQRTIKNVMYQSDSGSEAESAHEYSNNITTNTESNVPYPQQSTPAHVSIPLSDNVPPQSWEPPQHGFAADPIMPPPSLFSRIAPKPPKNIAQSSLPCVWSYNTECTAGIAPHYTSNFFHRLRERKEIKQAQSSKKGRIRNNGLASYQSSLKYQSQSQQQTMKRSKDNDEELGRRHSHYDQFVLNKHQPLQKLSQTRPVRRAQSKLQGLSPKIVSESPGMVNAKVGGNVLLTCTATGTLPIEYKWLRDGSNIPDKSTRITYPGRGLLQVNKVSAQDEGIYSCEVSNIHGSISRYFNLAIQAAGKESTVVDRTQTSLRPLSPASLSKTPPTKFNEEVPADVNVQEYLDTIVDEFRMIENESEYEIEQPADAKEHEVTSPVPKISVSKAFNNEMEHYLFGYGENYGQLSSSHILPDESDTQRRVESAYTDMNSVEVHTSLDSSQSVEHIDSHASMEVKLPIEVESVFDQVQRFHSSMEQNEISAHKAPQKKWFNRIFSKKK